MILWSEFVPALFPAAFRAREVVAVFEDEHVAAVLAPAQTTELVVIACQRDAFAHASLLETAQHLLVVDVPANFAWNAKRE